MAMSRTVRDVAARPQHQSHRQIGDVSVSDERLDLGLEKIQQVTGHTWRIEPLPGEPANVADLNRLLVEHAFADSWARPGLEDRTRSLITIAFVVALGQPEETKRHVRNALHLGLQKEEIIELLIHALAYCGAPRTASALFIARSVFNESPAETAQHQAASVSAG
jgi:4-carboxymuconolactone decarboxylase